MYIVVSDKSDKYKTGLNTNLTVFNFDFINLEGYPWAEPIKGFRIPIILSDTILTPTTGGDLYCPIDEGDEGVATIANKLILSEEYDLTDLKNIAKFNLNITNFMTYYVECACYSGNIKTLDYLKSTYKLSTKGSELFYASAGGNLNVLEWWKNNGFIFNFDIEYDIIEGASYGNNIDVLEWLKNHDFTSPNSKYKFTLADYSTVDAFLTEKQYPYHFNTNTIAKIASKEGYIKLLEWLKKLDIEFIYDETPMHSALFNNQIDVLNWWMNSGLPLKYQKNIMDDHDKNYEVENINPDTCKWWIDNILHIADNNICTTS